MRDINWANLWPTHMNGKSTFETANERPSFMNYCLMGTKERGSISRGKEIIFQKLNFTVFNDVIIQKREKATKSKF